MENGEPHSPGKAPDIVHQWRSLTRRVTPIMWVSATAIVLLTVCVGAVLLGVLAVGLGIVGVLAYAYW